MTIELTEKDQIEAYSAISEHEIDMILATDDQLYDAVDALLMDEMRVA